MMIKQQLIAGFGFCVAGCYPEVHASNSDTTTKTVLVTSSDPRGIQILVTAAVDNVVVDGGDILKERYRHFDACKCNCHLSALVFDSDDTHSSYSS